jgi:steroid 5-alpha-reductase/3-oxo-5-alpha-steroid 4-dehydrogenase 1
MDELSIHRTLLWVFLGLALVTLPALFFITAPYGRHRGQWKGPTVDSTLGWIVMEAPSAIVFFLCWLVSERRADPASIAFLLLWELHYVHRAFIFPFRRRGGEKRMPLLVAASAFTFTAINAYLNGRWVFTFAPPYGASWLFDWRFLLGTALFVGGFAVNQHADHVLFNLRKPGETGYKIPRGGFYRWVSCPNYFGEIIEWSGFALLTFSLPGLVFALWTIANLLPRARSHHLWYREKFPDYPAERRALVPGLF